MSLSDLVTDLAQNEPTYTMFIKCMILMMTSVNIIMARQCRTLETGSLFVMEGPMKGKKAHCPWNFMPLQ